MVVCSALGCSNRSSGKKKSIGISFFRFPKDPERRREWTKYVARKDWSPNDNSYLCMNHFEKEMINYTYAVGPRLREGAYPTIFKSIPRYMQSTATKRRKEPTSRNTTSKQSTTSFKTLETEHGYSKVLATKHGSFDAPSTEYKCSKEPATKSGFFEVPEIELETIELSAIDHESFEVPVTEIETIEVSSTDTDSFEVPVAELETIELSAAHSESFGFPVSEVEIIEVSATDTEVFEVPVTELECQNSNKPNSNIDNLTASQRTQISIKDKTMQDFDMANVITRLRKQISTKNKLIKNLRRQISRRDQKIKNLEDERASSFLDSLSL